MAKQYIAIDGGGGRTLILTTVSTGNVLHSINAGPTLGRRYDYSPAVNGTTSFFFVDNGPTLGRQNAAT
jgi:hypothetical protein